MKESTCIACGGSSIETAFTKGPFEIRRCRTCGLGRTADAEAFDAADYYSEAYFQGGHADSYGDYQGSEAILRAEFRRTIDYLLTQAPGRDRLLEFGCAYGFLLQEAAPELARTLHWAHSIVGWTLIPLIAAHVGGVLYHHVVRVDGTVYRMI